MNGEILAFIVYFVAIVGVGIYFFFKEKGEAYAVKLLPWRKTNGTVGGWQCLAQASDMSAWLVDGSSGKHSGVWIRADVDR